MQKNELTVTDEYRKVVNNIKTGVPLTFVTGEAGTGKSTLIDYIRDTVDKNIVVVAPTGVAALNAQGVTIHSFFRLPPHLITPQDIKFVNKSHVYKKIDVIIIDEVSMVRVDIMDAIDEFLRLNRQRHEAFGGVQIVLVGDLYQLPPVVRDNDRVLLAKMGYKTEFYFSSKVMHANYVDVIALTKIFRQTDSNFIDTLNAIRCADKDKLEGALQTINKLQGAPDPGHIVLASTNKIVTEKNSQMMDILKTPVFKYQGRIEGKFVVKDENLPVPMELCLKVGAKVMFTQNDSDRRWVNGSLGTVTKLAKSQIWVQLAGNEYVVSRGTWASYEYKMDGSKIKPKVVAKYEQYPLIPAWAITIHKSQGKTMDNIYLDLGFGAFATGQVYVALARVRSLAGITLARQLYWADIKISPVVTAYYNHVFKQSEIKRGVYGTVA